MAAITQIPVPGGWSDREITIDSHNFRLWTPTDPDEVLSHLESPEAATQPHLADPYWAKLWPAAPLLAGTIVRNKLSRGTRVLELGCGSGLVGIAALACGCDVMFSDYVPLAVDLALQNAARNGYSNANGLALDWRTVDGSVYDRFPLIVAADVTYDRTNIDPLLDVVECLLASGGQAWFGDAGRSPAADFFRRAQDRGFSVSLFDEHDKPVSALALGCYRRIVLRREP